MDTPTLVTNKLREAIRQAQQIYFEETCDDIDVGIVIVTTSGVMEFSKKDVDGLDPRLYKALRCVVERHPISHPAVTRRTLQHWHSPGAPREDKKGHYLWNVAQVYESRATPGSYVVRGSSYETYVIDDDIVIATWEESDCPCVVSEEWLDRYYPGVTSKIDLLQQIGLSEEEISELALQEHPTSNVLTQPGLPTEVSFDDIAPQ